MIPQQITLKNFLSYREATLDFRGLHTACICGVNGAGKSSLLEAIAWAIWGESRVASEDDIIHIGTKEAKVDFIFSSREQVYRVIRSRYRGQGSALELQVMTPAGFRTLTERSMRATQQLILQHLRLDYQTFVNSAYLRQGRADEFMLKRPSERKQILADLLKLDQYDRLAEQAKDKSRQFKGQVELLEQSLKTIEAQLQQRQQIEQEQACLEGTLAGLQQQQVGDRDRLEVLQTWLHQRQAWQQQFSWHQHQQRSLAQDCQQLEQELVTTRQHQQELLALLQQETAISAGYAHFQALQVQEEAWAEKLQVHQRVQEKRHQYQHQQAEKTNQLQHQLQHVQVQLEGLQQQQQEIQHTLNKVTDVEAGLDQLQHARHRLTQLDQLQTRVAPLLQRRQQLQSQLDRTSARLSARLEEIQTSANQLQMQQARQPQLQQAVLDVTDRIESLESRRVYQQRVREKGLERRSFMERLQAHQRDYERQLAELNQKMQLLRGRQQDEPVKDELVKDELVKDEQRVASLSLHPAPLLAHPAPYPPCPLCDRPLDEHHWNLVLEKHQNQQQEILDQIWVIREQLAVSEREIQVLRQEYRELEQELGEYAVVLERRGRLQEQLQVTAGSEKMLQQLATEAKQIERSLRSGEYAHDLFEELQLLDRSLEQLNYDEKDHALARGLVDRWRWAEIKQAEIKQAQRRQKQMAERQPQLAAQFTELQERLVQLQQETGAGLAILDRQLSEIGYNLEQHNALRQTLRQAQVWQLRRQELQQAQQQYPQIQQRIERLVATLQERLQQLQGITHQLEIITQQLAQSPDPQADIQVLERQMQQRRLQLDEYLARFGHLQAQRQQQVALSTQHLAISAQLQTARRQGRVYQELTQAFGKNGLQALMIENVLPQLEAETNQILSRLSANQLHVQFVTQKAGKGNKSAKHAKLIDTLDILIADARGTRAYETYSGGEAFRINFAIRLALARLLAQRAGTALQLLIVDEGFGTQDHEGCDRLIAAINAIAADFACILTVTHMPHLKEAFQARIEVSKSEQGSRLTLSL